MEEAIANCPDLFIEPGVTLIRRQVVINGRRPDLLFCDKLSRHLLVEIQSGRLDEEHLQRHFYYYFDYRAKYPSTHLPLMFIAKTDWCRSTRNSLMITDMNFANTPTGNSSAGLWNVQLEPERGLWVFPKRSLAQVSWHQTRMNCSTKSNYRR